MSHQPLRTVYHVPGTSGEFQSLYFDREAKCLRPNLSVLYADGTVCFETNEIGLKGDPVDPGRKLAVVWGDFVVFGMGLGWPRLIDPLVPGYQFLNGGIEADSPENILTRAIKLNQEREVGLNIILPGWHGNSYSLEKTLTIPLDNIPNLVLATMPTALNRRIASEDISAFFAPGTADVCFLFAGKYEYSIATQAQLFERILIRNAATRKAAAAKQVPLIDLFAVFDTEQMADFRQDFFDVMHPRASAYPKMARAVYEGIKPVLALA